MSVSLLAVAGCLPGATGNSTLDGNNGLDPKDFPNLRIQGEPNDTFSEPLDVVYNDTGRASLIGSIATADDVDVYNLGPMKAGDRILIDVGSTGNLDSAVALFDEGGVLAFENDDRSTNLGQLDPFLNEVVRRDSAIYFLGICAAPLGSSSTATGTYHIEITVARDGAPAATRAQTIVLNFAGGTISIPDDPRSPYTVGTFDTADIWPAYAGLTSATENRIVEVVRNAFQGFAVQVLRVPGDILPVGDCAYSTVFFGGRNPNAYGTSQQVDAMNQDVCDESIVFTEMFTPSRFGRLLSGEELGTAIGNVTAHEIGHLLGLNHVDNVTDLMDTTGGANTFLYDQQFKNSPLDYTIFPIGSQDGFLLLLETLGSGG